MRITQKILTQLEQCFALAGYKVRYEKGNFQSGYCLIVGQKTIIINQFINTEGRVFCLVEVLKQNLEIINMQEDDNKKMIAKLLAPEKEDKNENKSEKGDKNEENENKENSAENLLF